MLPSNPGTRWYVVSAGIAWEHVPKPHTVTVKTYSPFHSDHESFADVREVSADLEATHPARPAACQAAFSRAQAPYPLP